jgi:hypothetical protein
MKATEKKSIQMALWEKLGFRLIDDEERQRVDYWGVLSGHDDERLDRPVRYGEWPEASHMIIQRLWHNCMSVAQRDARRQASHSKLALRLNILLFSLFAVFIVLSGIPAANSHQFEQALRWCRFLIAAALGAKLMSWALRD